MATLNKIADEVSGALARPFDYMFKERIKSAFRHEAFTMVRQAINKDGLSPNFKSKFGMTIGFVDYSSVSTAEDMIVFKTIEKVPKPIRFNTDDPFSFVGNADGTVVFIHTTQEELPYADLTEVYSRLPVRYIYKDDYIYLHNTGYGVSGTIDSVADYSTTVAGTIAITSVAHKLKTGMNITVLGTVNYNATYSITVIDVDTIQVTAAFVITEDGIWSYLSGVNTNITIEGSYPLGDVFDDSIESQLYNKVLNDDTELPLAEDLIQAIKLKLLSSEFSIIDSKDKAVDAHIDN